MHLKISFHFVMFVIVLVALNGVLGKRGCASFGHSCYGGHGKRSQQGVELFSSDLITDKDVNKHSLDQNQDLEPSERYTGIYDVIGKPDVELKSLLQKLTKFYEENQQPHAKNIPKYFNY